jgi:acyl-CoA synthetase (AMP-forming)/AMP-acid ligase II
VVSIDPVGDERRGGASGRALPHLDVRAYTPDGTPLAPGGVGELRIQAAATGPWAGRWTPYLGLWRSGRVESSPGDAIATGDIGAVDADGWVRILDRLKVLIIRGGANVYPAEVERLLLAQPGVAGAVVFGTEDERLGERVAALVELQDGAAVTVDELRAICQQELAGYKVPDRWGIVDSLPRNAMGKVVRTGLVDLLTKTKGAPDDGG